MSKALSSPNYGIQSTAANGLALLGYKDSIKPIIEVCAKSGATIAPVIAKALVFFDDPEAEAAAERFIKNSELLQGLRTQKARFGARGLWR